MTKIPRPKYHPHHVVFGTSCVYWNGVYYFPQDVKPSTVRPGKPFEIQGTFYAGNKWKQDTFYLTQETHDLLTAAVPKK